MREAVFAQGLCFEKLFLILIIGGVLGDLAETIFCRVKMGKWTNRSSLIYGQISLVWGMAMVIATVLFYRMKGMRTGVIFAAGTIFGGIFEYVCGAAAEKVFGVKFWDYSKMRFNLAGRINLIYCFYWGIASVIWMEDVLPPLEKIIECIPVSLGETICEVLLVGLLIDGVVSVLALRRYSQRKAGHRARNMVTARIDEHFNDEWMEKRYPCMKLAKPQQGPVFVPAGMGKW